MANIEAVYAVGNSLVTSLRNRYQLLAEKPVGDCGFSLLSSADLSKEDPKFLDSHPTNLSLFLHRVTISEHGRNTSQLPSKDYTRPPLTVDLHFLMTAWSDEALFEQVILAWSMQQLHQHPILEASSLSPANWQPEDRVQVIPTDLSLEDIMRIWDSLQPSYRLSVAYVARVVRIDSAEDPQQAPPVVTRRFAWSDDPAVALGAGAEP
jgi:hypothetical protein